MTTATIQGAVRRGDVPAAGAEVLWIAAGMDRLLGTVTTGADGRFRIADASTPGELLVRLAAPDRALVAHRHVDPGDGDIDLDLGAVAPVTLAAEIDSDSGWPPVLNVSVDPDAVEHVPPGLARFFLQKGPGVFAGHFLTVPVRGRTFSIEVSPGTYRVSGEYLNYDRPMMVDPPFDNYLVDRVVADGTDGDVALPGEPYGGFRVAVAGDVRLRLRLRAVANEEL